MLKRSSIRLLPQTSLPPKPELPHSDKKRRNTFYAISIPFNLLNLKLQLLNLSAMEVNIVRPFVAKALETFYKLDSPEMIQDAERRPDARSQAADRGPRVSSLFKFINTKISDH